MRRAADRNDGVVDPSRGRTGQGADGASILLPVALPVGAAVGRKPARVDW